ncbi:MAG: T9SS type A sorting domain-containing protein [Bacteroidota bacterium]
MFKKILYCYTILLISVGEVNAQLPGSISSYGGSVATKSVASGGTSVDVSETVYIGPGTHNIEGVWEIYARQIVIDPTTIISGSGRIEYYNPSAASGAASTTLVDGNATANSLDVDMLLQNADGMQLSEMTFPLSHLSAGWTNNTSASTIYVGRNVFLSVDGADIILGSSVPGDLRFDNDAAIFNYRPARMIITNNSILSHVVKENHTSAFVFPVGIADGDYTPVQISNISANTIHVSVQDYLSSASVEATTDPGTGGFPADGIQRTWHIFGDVSGSGSNINLQHNSITNQSGFDDVSHFITQWSATAPNPTGDNTIPYSTSAWQSNTPGSGSVGSLITPSGVLGGSSMRSRIYSTLATSGTAEESYFTKSADPSHPLPLHFLSNIATGKQCNIELKWAIGAESIAEFFTIMHSNNGKDYKPIGTVSAIKNISNYQYTHTTASESSNFYIVEMKMIDGSSVRSSTMKANTKCPSTNVKIYPNPSQDFVTIEHLNIGQNSLKIYSIEGKLISQMDINRAQNNKFLLDISELKKGTYFLKIYSLESNKEESFKIIKD